MKRSHLAGNVVRIGLFVTMVLFTVQLGLALRAEAAPKSVPVAILPADFKVVVGETVSVDGNLSYDPFGKKINFKWELLYAPPDSKAKIVKKNSATPIFTADKPGKYFIKLTVSNGVKSSSALLVVTASQENVLVPVNTRVYTGTNSFGDLNNRTKYSIDIGSNRYTLPEYFPGTESDIVLTGFQVLVLNRATLTPATVPAPYSYNQTFGGNDAGYSAMATFLKTLTSTGLLVIISSQAQNDNLMPSAYLNALTTEIERLGGKSFKAYYSSLGPHFWYSLIGVPGVNAGNGFEFCDPTGEILQSDIETSSIQGFFTMDRYSNFQFIYPNFTPFETKSSKDAYGNFTGSIKVGENEFTAGPFPSGKGGFNVLYLFRPHLDSENTYSKIYYTNGSSNDAGAVQNLVTDLASASGCPYFVNQGLCSPGFRMVIIQSIGVPFGAHTSYEAQAIRDLEKMINNLGGTDSTFHALYNNPGPADTPNKYSLLGIAFTSYAGMPTTLVLPTTDTLAANQGIEACTLDLQSDFTWAVSSKSDGNVRGLLNKNKQSYYSLFLASGGLDTVDFSLPTILFQDPTPWITAPPGVSDNTRYVAAYTWISNYLTGQANAYGVCIGGAVTLKGGECGDLRTYYPTIDNPWANVLSTLNGVPMDDAVKAYLSTHTDFSYSDEYLFMRDQLREEVNKVETAYILFHDDVLAFFQDLHDYQNFYMTTFYNNAYTILGINPTSTNTTQSVLNVLHAVLKQISMQGFIKGSPVGPIAGIAAAAVGITSHFIPDTDANPVAGVITSTIQDLWDGLYTKYLSDTFILRKSYELTVSDWGKLQSVVENVYGKWNESYREQALSSMIAGFETSIYKILLPIAAYQVELLPGTQYAKPGDFQTCSKTVIGHNCESYGHHWDVPLPNYLRVASQGWDPLQVRQANDLYSVYKGNVTTGKISYIPSATLNSIFAPYDGVNLNNLGVSRIEFFTRWGFKNYYWPSYDSWCYTCGHLW